MLNALEFTALSSSTTKWCCFRSAPFLCCALRWFSLFRDRHSTSMLHRGYCGWGRLTSSSITTVSRTCQFQKCIRMSVRVSSHPLHPSNGKGIGPTFARNAILYILRSLPRLPSRPPALNPPSPRRAGFGGAQTLTPSPSPSITMGS